MISVILSVVLTTLALAQDAKKPSVEWTSLTRSEVSDDIGVQLKWQARLRTSSDFTEHQAKEIASLARADGTLEATFNDDDGVISVALLTQLLLKPFLESVGRNPTKVKAADAMFQSPAIQWNEVQNTYREQLERMILSDLQNAGSKVEDARILLAPAKDLTLSLEEATKQLTENLKGVWRSGIPFEIVTRVLRRETLTYKQIAIIGEAMPAIMASHYYRVTYSNGSDAREFAESTNPGEERLGSERGQLFQITNQFPITATLPVKSDQSPWSNVAEWPNYKFSITLPDAGGVVNANR